MKIIKSNQEVPGQPLTGVIFGMPGMGKTSLSFTCQGNILHIDFDRGVRRAVNKLRPDTVVPEDWADFHTFIFSKPFEKMVIDNDYKTVVIDTIGTMLDDFLAPHLVSSNPKNGNGSGGLGLSGFGTMQTVFSLVKARLTGLGLEIMAICHAKEDGGEMKQLRLDVKGGSNGIIQRSADFIGYLYIKGGKRYIDFAPSDWHLGKDVAGLGEVAVPESILPDYDTFMQGVFGACASKMSSLSASQVEFQETLQQWIEVLEPCKTPGDFDGFIQSVAPMEAGLLKETVKAYLGKALTAHRCKYDATLKRVVSLDATADVAPVTETENDPDAHALTEPTNE